MAEKGWAVWFVGLPGSGKSSVAASVVERLRELGFAVVYLQMDERRKVYFPNPEYTSEERAKAYEMFVEEGAKLVEQGQNVVMDGTAAKAEMRDQARQKIDNFVEIHIDCSLETAMQREADRPEGLVMSGLYSKALKRKKDGSHFPGLGPVIGVDVPFERSDQAELRVDNDGNKSLDDAVSEVMDFLKHRLDK
ncbi:MAG: adenylyl-sulfate kinase [Thermodesulfobacteriota bacterium]